MDRISCNECNRKFPAHLIQRMTIFGGGKNLSRDMCPICALRTLNEMHGLPPDTPFTGEIARSMYDEAVRSLEKINGTK